MNWNILFAIILVLMTGFDASMHVFDILGIQGPLDFSSFEEYSIFWITYWGIACLISLMLLKRVAFIDSTVEGDKGI